MSIGEAPGFRTRGACLCGAVRFAIAPPYPWFSHCHCSMCRKHHGSLFSTGLGVARTRFEWLADPSAIVHYRASAAFERPFCRHCGSTVPGSSHDERYWHVPAGLLDGDPGDRPRTHIFVESRSSIDELCDTLPRHSAYPPGIDVPAVASRSVPRSPGGVTGSCLCDAVAFAVTEAPRCVVNCYCSLCRRRSGAAFSSTLLTTAAHFRWLRGVARIRHYALPAPRSYTADSCTDCGSPVPSVGAGQEPVMLPAGAIDDPLPPLPAVHLYVGSKAAWYTITDNWPQFEALPPPERFTDFFQ
jgi:hypothetical protein